SAVPYEATTNVEARRGFGDDAANALQRVWEGIKCLGDCRKSWGWSGNHFGGDPWGGVLKLGDPVPYSGSVSNAASSPDTNSSNSASSSAENRDGFGILNVQSRTTTITAPTVEFSVFEVPTLVRSSSTATPTPTSAPPPPPPSEEPSPSPEPQPEPSPVEPQPQPEPEPEPTQEQPTNNVASVDTNTNNNNGNTNNNNSNNNNNNNNNNAVSGDRQQYLDAHNSARALHGANPVTWSDQLEGFAQEWANNCQFKHSGGKFGRVGENLAAGTGTYTIPEMVNDWVVEVKDYRASNPVASHFTQVVWKATTQIGCAKATCNGIFSAPATYYVCEYLEAGNVIGNFAANVQA
ncbi:hypothetical protein FRC17_007489, partial [Serendipita sp. 399]